MNTYRERQKRQQEVRYQDIPRKISFDYVHVGLDFDKRMLDELLRLCEHLKRPEIDMQGLMQDAALLIQKQFSIGDVSIGLKDSKDGLYRYKVMVGIRDDALAWRKSAAYKREEFSGAEPYKGYDISKYTRLYLTEDQPWSEGEESSYNRPALIPLKRRSTTHFLEGDFIDVHMFGRDDELVGWIEVSGTRVGEFPDVTAIKWMELISQIISSALIIQEMKGAPESAKQEDR